VMPYIHLFRRYTDAFFFESSFVVCEYVFSSIVTSLDVGFAKFIVPIFSLKVTREDVFCDKKITDIVIVMSDLFLLLMTSNEKQFLYCWVSY
jgi:hypothetical protein